MSPLTSDEMWSAVERRDSSCDGIFYFGVVTTGVFCKPSCRCRRPLRRNVRFFATAADAARAGLRPCLRCKPLDPNPVQSICRYIEKHCQEQTISLDALSVAFGLSPSHLQRTFKAATGLSPKEYADACRLRSLKSALRESDAVTAAIYDAGYSGPSRVYSRSDAHLGMTPKQYRKGGEGTAISYLTAGSPLGPLMIGATDRGICFVQFGDSSDALLAQLAAEYPNAQLAPAADHPQLAAWMDALRMHMSGIQSQLDLPLDIRATAFQMRVWTYLQSIPYGDVQSYSEVAAGIGQPAAARAVARACATNRIAMLIPCHRVIRGTGELGGYRWGIARKRTLLDRERAAKATAAASDRTS